MTTETDNVVEQLDKASDLVKRLEMATAFMAEQNKLGNELVDLTMKKGTELREGLERLLATLGEVKPPEVTPIV